MNKKSHKFKNHVFIAIGALIFLWYMNKSYSWIQIDMEKINILLLAGIAVIYSLMPDIDQPGSHINKYFSIALIGIIIASFYFDGYSHYGIISAVILLMLKFINHRTLIHSVAGAVAISAPLLYFGFIYFIVGFISFLTHIVSDGDFSIFAEKDWW